MLNELCFSSVVGRDIVMVHGLIYGSEVIATRQSLQADMVLKVLDANNLTVKYESTAGYHVRDTQSSPKFWITSEMRVDIPGFADLTSPAQRLALIRHHIGEKLAGVSFHEQAPTKETVTELQKKITRVSIKLGFR